MGFAKRSDFIPSSIAEKISRVASMNNEGNIVVSENGRKKVSLTEVISRDFTEVRLVSTWTELVKDWAKYKSSLLENKWFIDVAFGTPKWASLHDFTLAINSFLKFEPDWSNSEWFYNDIVLKYKPTKKLADKKLALCHECGKDIYLIKVLNKDTEAIEDIEVNSKLFTVTLQNAEMSVISQLGEVNQLKNVGSGFQKHSITCTQKSKKPIAFIKPQVKK